MHKVIVVDNPETWKIKGANLAIVSSHEYLTNPDWAKARKLRVFNLCRSYSYQSKGYYVSLLAEARGHKPIPTVRNILDVQKPFVIKMISEDMDSLIQRRLKDLRSDEFILSVYFGRNLAEKYDDLSNLFYRMFRVPFLAGPVRPQHQPAVAYQERQDHLGQGHPGDSLRFRPAPGRGLFLAETLRLGQAGGACRPLRHGDSLPRR